MLAAVLDTLAIARDLTVGGIDRGHAEVLANAIRQAAEQGDHVTRDHFNAGLADVRTEFANVRTR